MEGFVQSIWVTPVLLMILTVGLRISLVSEIDDISEHPLLVKVTITE